MGIVYHGSSIGDLKIINKRNGTHNLEAVYATKNYVTALLFMGKKGRGDLDFSISVNNGILEIVERRPGLLEKTYNHGGFLYELSDENFKSYDFLWSEELISNQNEKPLLEKYIPNILKELIKCSKEGSLNLYQYPNRPSNIPLDNSDLLEKYYRFYKNGKVDALNQVLLVYPELNEKISLLESEEDIEVTR